MLRRFMVPSLAAAMVLGTTVEVDTLHGKASLDIPQGTSHGRDFRLRHQGIERLDGSGKGDHVVTVEASSTRPLIDVRNDALATPYELDFNRYFQLSFRPLTLFDPFPGDFPVRLPPPSRPGAITVNGTALSLARTGRPRREDLDGSASTADAQVGGNATSLTLPPGRAPGLYRTVDARKATKAAISNT